MFTIWKRNRGLGTFFTSMRSSLEHVRKPILQKLIDLSSGAIARVSPTCFINLLQLIIDPYSLCLGSSDARFVDIINTVVEPLCRKLCYTLHTERYRLLCDIGQASKRKRCRS